MFRIFSAKIVLTLLGVTVLDFGFLGGYAMAAFRPILAYLLILYIAFEWEPLKALPIAVILGLLRDFVGVYPFGVETVVLSLATLVLAIFVSQVDRRSLYMRLGVAFAFTFIVLFSILILSSILKFPPGLSWNNLLIAVIVSLSCALCTPIFFWITHRWLGRTALKQLELFRW